MTQYFCDSKRRAEAADDHPTINGIDYLEVLDQEAIPLNSPRQHTLLVRCFKPLPSGTDALAANNVEIGGGVRVTPVGVEWAGRASDAADLFAANLINAAERDFFLALDDPDRVLLVRTDSEGDFSNYRLRLRLSPTSELPPPNFDPILSRVDFSFKVECDSDFDCAPVDDCPPEQFDEPAINYLAKDYASFRRVLLDRLAVIMPDWRERNPADLGIALVELLAYAADYASYHQDAVNTEMNLGLARQRASVRRHARLLDYAMHDGANARAWVCLEVSALGDGVVVPSQDPLSGQPSRLLTRIHDEPLIATADLDKLLQVHQPQIFEPLHDVTLYEAHNEISLYTWGDADCCLPQGATRATLHDDAASRLRLRAGDVLVFEEQIDPATGRPENADPGNRHAVRLTRVSPEATLEEDGSRSPGPVKMDELLGEPIVEVAWDAADALPYPVCVSTVLDGIAINDVSTVRGNVVLVDHGYTVAGETLAARKGGRRLYRPVLQETNITHATPYDDGVARKQPVAASLGQDPRAALPAVTLSAPGETWTPQRDLLGSDRFATEFVMEMDNSGRGHLRFGDGVYGMAPDESTALEARYRIGNGPGGNVGAGAIAHLVGNFSGVRRVFNPLPAQGGAAPETLEEVRQYAPQAFRTQERAVTEADYASVIERHPQVQKAVATRRWTGSWYTMFVTVDRIRGLPVDAAFEDELCQFVERFRLAVHDVEIDAPRFVSLEIVMGVCVKPGYFRSDVEEALLRLFSCTDLPNGQRGFFHPDRFTFGQSVYLSQIIAAAMDVAGVQWVDLNDKPGSPHRFQRWGETPGDEIATGEMEMARLEIARLANDPSRPEHGRIEFLMEGGL
jgi:hypothetical protein